MKMNDKIYLNFVSKSSWTFAFSVFCKRKFEMAICLSVHAFSVRPQILKTTDARGLQISMLIIHPPIVEHIKLQPQHFLFY